MNKPKVIKWKQPTERKLVTSKKKKQNDSQPEGSNHFDDHPDDWLPVEVQDGQPKDPVFDPKTCPLPPYPGIGVYLKMSHRYYYFLLCFNISFISS